MVWTQMEWILRFPKVENIQGDVSAGVAPLAQKERAGNKKNEPVIRNV
jgi:hypothetical protein